MSALLAVIIMTIFLIVFGMAIVFLTPLLGVKRKPTPAKNMPYECGVPGQAQDDTKINVKFYLTAILFILFDIEIIFMYPWAITFGDFMKQGLGGYVLAGMGVFVLLFVVGLIWEVKSKALDWN